MTTKPKPHVEQFQKKSRACICGATWRIAANVPGTAKLVTTMEQMHTGAGHAPCTPVQAKRVRQKLEKRDGEKNDG